MSRPPDADAVLPRHVEDEALLAYLDGELDRAEATIVAAHLEQCWQCRGRVGTLESAIHAFLATRERQLPADLGTGRNVEAVFRRRLAERAAEGVPHPTILGRLRARLSSGPRLRRAVTGIAVAGLLLIAVATWWSVPVSAEHVLARAEVYELIDIRTSSRVVHAIVDVDRIDVRTGTATRVGTVETFTDPASFAVRTSVRAAGGSLDQAVLWGREALASRRPLAGAFSAPLVRYFEEHQWSPSVDVGGYRRLVADRGDASASATRAGRFFEITHPFAAGHPSGIAEARLYVDAASWLPARVSLFLAGPVARTELRFSRTTLEFLPRTDTDARLFATARREPLSTPAPGTTVTPDTSRGNFPRRPLPLSWDASQATDDEAAVARVLHAIGADLGEEVNVFPMSDRSLLVQGLVETAGRRQQIERALRRLPAALRIEIHLPEELRTGSELFAPPWRAPAAAAIPPGPAPSAPVVVVDTAGHRMAVQERLEAHLERTLQARGVEPTPDTTRQAISTFSNDVVSRSRQALFHAWALYRLDQEFRADRNGGLSASVLASIADIRQAHRDSLTRLARELATSVEPLLGAASPPVNPTPLENGVEPLLKTVSEVDGLVRELFTVSANPVEVSVSLPRLSSLLKQVAQERVPLS